MKFGAPDSLDQLDSLDFSLPQDHPSNKTILSRPKKDTAIYIGCSAWGQDEWVGDVYPEGTKKKDYLEEYIRHFSCVELNTTFYNIKKASMQSWAEKASGHTFKYCPKFNRQISHIKRLKEVEELTDYFVERCREFGENLGITFLQMPENFSAKYLERVHAYLSRIPADFPMAVELRHPSWYEREAFDETFHMLSEHNKTAVITDTATKRDLLHQRLSTHRAFIRFAAYEDHPTNEKRLDEWADRLTTWIQQGVSDLYFFCKQEDERYAPKLADYMIRQLNEKAGLALKSPYA